MHENDQEFHWKIILTDEAHFQLADYVKKPTCRVWVRKPQNLLL